MHANLASLQMAGMSSQEMGKAKSGSGIGKRAKPIVTSRLTRLSALTLSGIRETAAGLQQQDGMVKSSIGIRQASSSKPCQLRAFNPFVLAKKRNSVKFHMNLVRSMQRCMALSCRSKVG